MFYWKGLGTLKHQPVFSVCFSKFFTQREHVNLACSIICLRLEGNISSPVRYSYLSIFPDINVYIVAAFLLTSYCSFLSLVLPSVVIISFYILFRRFFLKRKGLPDAIVVLVTKKEYGLAINFM